MFKASARIFTSLNETLSEVLAVLIQSVVQFRIPGPVFGSGFRIPAFRVARSSAKAIENNVSAFSYYNTNSLRHNMPVKVYK